MDFLGSLALVAAQLLAAAPVTQNARSAEPASTPVALALPDTPASAHERQVDDAASTREPSLAEGEWMPAARDTPAYAERIAAARQRNAVNANLNQIGELSRGGNNQ